MIRFLTPLVLMMALVLSAITVAADDQPKQIDQDKLERLKQKLKDLDPEKRKEILEKLEEKLKDLDPEKRKEILEKLGGTIDAEKKDKKGADKKGGSKAADKFEALFKKLDANGDGKLSKDEFKKLAELGQGKLKDNPELIDKLLEKLDANGDGFLTLEEFKKLSELKQD